MKNFFNEKLPLMLVMAALSCLIFFIIAIFGAAFLNLLGVYYTSRGSLVWYFFLATIIGLPLAPLENRLQVWLISRFLKIGYALYFIYDLAIGTLILLLVDDFYPQVSVSLLAAFLTSLLFALIAQFPTSPDD